MINDKIADSDNESNYNNDNNNNKKNNGGEIVHNSDIVTLLKFLG